MSEWIPKDQPRPIRILALHGDPNQSAASYRALISPLIKALPQWYEFHFLEGGFAIRGQGTSMSEMQENVLRCSEISALKGEIEAGKVRAEMERRDVQDSDVDERRVRELQSALENTPVWKEFKQTNSLDAAEAVLARQGELPLDRTWHLPDSKLGLQASIGRIGSYMREYGPFHAGIGSGSGYAMLRLISALLDRNNHPQSAIAYPLLFPLLPLDSPAPRMGGWDVLPSVSLPSGRRHAVSQGGLLCVVNVLGMGREGCQVVDDQVRTWEKRATAPLHSLAVMPRAHRHQVERENVGVAATHSHGPLFSSPITRYTARFIRSVCLQSESVPGLNPYDERRRVGEQETSDSPADGIEVRWDRTSSSKL